MTTMTTVILHKMTLWNMLIFFKCSLFNDYSKALIAFIIMVPTTTS